MDVLRPIGVGVLTAVITFALDPSPPWWLVGVIAAVILLANPCRPR